MSSMEQIKNTMEDAFKDKMRVLWYNILVIVALTVCFVITALVAASAADSKSFGFVAVWTALLSALFIIAVYFLYKRADKRSALAVGMLIGVSFMMSMQHLTLAIYAAALAADDDSSHGEQDSERALTAFAILLMLADLFLCGLVATSTNVLLPSSSDALNPAPPAAATTGTAQYNGGAGYDTGNLTDTTQGDTYEGAPDGADAQDVDVKADTAV